MRKSSSNSPLSECTSDNCGHEKQAHLSPLLACADFKFEFYDKPTQVSDEEGRRPTTRPTSGSRNRYRGDQDKRENTEITTRENSQWFLNCRKRRSDTLSRPVIPQPHPSPDSFQTLLPTPAL